MSDEGRAFELVPWEGRAILLVDLDAFFASVEQLDHPAWRGKPVIVGGDPEKRGVVSTASYEARAFGVHSAMPSSQAARLCPQAIWTHGHFDRYREMSNAVMAILYDETPFVQQVSIDEAFMDVTPSAVNPEHPVSIARRIQHRVAELGVTCSIGVGTTKSVAKLASDMDKPRGLTVVFPGTERSFMDPLPVGAMSGIGKASQEKLRQYGIETLGQLAQASDQLVEGLFGKNGKTMLARARGQEADSIEADEGVKSVSNELSFAEDLEVREDIEAAIATMAAKVGRRLRMKGIAGSTIALKVRYANRSVRTMQRTAASLCDDENEMFPLLLDMLDELWQEGTALRLVGVAVTGFGHAAGVQHGLFDEGGADGPAATRKLAEATDKVRERFGEHAVSYGRELRTAANTTGSSSKNPEDYK